MVPHKSSRSSRTITKAMKKNDLSNAQEFSPDQIRDAIKKSKPSKALGPDGISTLHLKHLGPKGIEYLTNIFNLSINTSTIPAIWKTSIIIPLLKPKKDAGDSGSYRPVSLLSPAIKTLERLLLPTLTDHLPVPDIQHGFRKNHSTITALNDFNQAIAGGFNKKKPADRTILLQLDLSKAFDMVSHNKLLNDINHTDLPPAIKRWFNCYLHGRQSKVNFRNKTSTSRNVRTGVPQGAVTSPILFNFYLSKLPTPPANVHVVQYADDISVYCSGTDLAALSRDIQQYATALTAFLEERELIVSPEKSTVTLFTPDTKEANIHPTIIVNNTAVKLEKNPKLLGITFDTIYTFTHHIKSTIAKAKNKINILKSLCGSTWGQEKETIIITYKSICRSTLEYGAAIWSPSISETNWQKLQCVQNQALRVATGCLLMSNAEHLHQETKVLPIKEHATLISKQFLASCFVPGHPGAKHINRPPDPRNMKNTILQYREQISPTLL